MQSQVVRCSRSYCSLSLSLYRYVSFAGKTVRWQARCKILSHFRPVQAAAGGESKPPGAARMLRHKRATNETFKSPLTVSQVFVTGSGALLRALSAAPGDREREIEKDSLSSRCPFCRCRRQTLNGTVLPASQSSVRLSLATCATLFVRLRSVVRVVHSLYEVRTHSEQSAALHFMYDASFFAHSQRRPKQTSARPNFLHFRRTVHTRHSYVASDTRWFFRAPCEAARTRAVRRGCSRSLVAAAKLKPIELGADRTR